MPKLPKMVRIAASLTKAEMGRRCGMTRQAYGNFENRNTTLSEVQLANLLEIFPGTPEQFCRLIRKAAKEL